MTHNDRPINDTDTFSTFQLEIRVHNAILCTLLRHHGSSCGVEYRGSVVSNILLDLCIGVGLREVTEGAYDIVLPGLSGDETLGGLGSFDQGEDIELCAQEVGVYNRLIEGVIGGQFDFAA